MSKSLYIHIPFCRKKCSYCDFYSCIFNKDSALDYLNVICKQIDNLSQKFNTIFIGGGTPTVIGKQLMEKLLVSLKDRTSKDVEFTVEANPESFDKDMAQLLLEHNVNRISMGLQSLNPKKLKKLGRIHSRSDGIRAITLAREIGFNNINADFIFGIWGEDHKAWKIELSEIVKLPLTHVSCYGLTYEKGTVLFKDLQNQKIFPLSDATSSKMFRHNLDYLPANGFKHYEVSNFAKSGFCCKHNLNYWDNNHYWALGASASYFLMGIRASYIFDHKSYTQKVKKGDKLIFSEEKLSRQKFAKETAALKIRTAQGISLSWFKKKTGYDLLNLQPDALKPLVAKKLIKILKKKKKITSICLTKKGFLFADEVSSSFF